AVLINPILRLAAVRFGPLRVPEILTSLIPKILACPAVARRDRSLLLSPLGKQAGWKEEDVGNVEAPRSRNLAQGRSPANRGGAFDGSLGSLCPAHGGGSPHRACR